MKNKILLSFVVSIVILNKLFSQENEKKFEPSGKATGTVFFNYHYDMTKDVENKSQFEIMRTYFGYNYSFSEQLSSNVLFDIGHDGKQFTAFLKSAALKWKMNKHFAIEGGMISTHTWDVQEKFYGYRYVLETLQDKDKFYSSADLGVKATIKPIDMLEFHIGIWNGEGYKKVQDNYGVHKASFDVVIKPIEGLTLKAYYDNMPKRDTTSTVSDDLKKPQSITNFFIGYEKKDLFRLGAEYNMLNNASHKKDNKLTGISIYGSVMFKKFELFSRFDILASNKLDGAAEVWNIAKDYSMVMGGLQYAPVKGVKVALNYRHFTPKKSGAIAMDLLYLNLEYKF